MLVRHMLKNHQLKFGAIITFVCCAVVITFGIGSNAYADNIGVVELHKADKAYKKARKEWLEALENGKRDKARREKAWQDYQNVWTTAFEDLRLKKKAYNDALNSRSENLRENREKVAALEIKLFRANQAEKSAKAALVNMLESLKEEEGKENSSKNLLNNLRKSADELRAKWQRAEEAKILQQTTYDESVENLAKLKTLLDDKIAELRSDIPNDVAQGLFESYSEKMHALPKAIHPDKISELKIAEENTANDLYKAIIKTLPPYVKSIEVTLAGDKWYEADVETLTNPNPDKIDDESLLSRYESAYDDNEKEIEALRKLLRQIDFKMRNAREAWELATEYEGYAAAAIELRNRDMLAYTFVIEASAVIAGSILTSGTGGPAFLSLAQSVTRAGKYAWTAQNKKLMVTLFRKGFLRKFNTEGFAEIWKAAAQTANGKFYSELLLTGGSGAVDYWGGLSGATGENYFHLTNKEGIVYGDAIETFIANGLEDTRNLATNLWTNSAEAGKAATGLSITVAATGAKVVAQMLTDTLNDDDARDQLIYHLKAHSHRRVYFRLLRLRNVMRADLERYLAVREILSLNITNGNQPRTISVRHNNSVKFEDASKIGQWLVRVTFSRPLNHPPVLMDNKDGVQFSKAQLSENGRHQWLFEPTSFDVPEDAEQIELLIDLSSNETPYTSPDGDPRTPVSPTGLNWHKLNNYERDADRNHILILEQACKSDSNTYCEDQTELAHFPKLHDQPPHVMVINEIFVAPLHLPVKACDTCPAESFLYEIEFQGKITQFDDPEKAYDAAKEITKKYVQVSGENGLRIMERDEAYALREAQEKRLNDYYDKLNKQFDNQNDALRSILKGVAGFQLQDPNVVPDQPAPGSVFGPNSSQDDIGLDNLDQLPIIEPLDLSPLPGDQ